MAKIFNKIRRRLLLQKKLLGYISYATGEIILVVIGILIALQVDKMVQYSIDIKEANAFESRLLKEVESNIHILTRKMNRLTERSHSAKSILEMTGPEYVTQDVEMLNCLLENVLHFNNIRLGYGALNEGIGNGELDLIQSDSLRAVLYELPVHIEAVKTNEKLLNEEYYSGVIPYLNKNYHRRNIDAYSQRYKDSIGPSYILKGNDLALLNELEFENHIRTILFHNLSLRDHYRGLKRRYTKFSVVLKKELAKNKK